MKKIFIILGILIAGVGLYILLDKTTPAVAFLTQTKDISTTTEATIISVGDIFLHTNNLSAAYNSKTKTYNFDSAFSEVENYFKSADVSTAWLGGVMSTSGPYTGYPSFKSPAALVDTLGKIGLDVAYRTNHTMDFGIKGLNATTEILQKNNINQVAGYATEEASKEIFVYQKNDLKISFLGYIYGMNGLPIPKKWMINLIDLKKIENDIKIAKTKSDFVVIALHFGNEYERYPNKWQKETAQKVADFGADLIIASHPHVLQPVDTLTAKDGRKVYVAYGLGNFYCGQRFKYTDAGVILKYTVEKTAGKTTLKNISYIPTWVAEYKENSKTQYKILPSQKYLELYKSGQAKFLSVTNYNRLKQTYEETVKHLDNSKIGFTEYKTN